MMHASPPAADLDALIANLSGSRELAELVVDEFLAHVGAQLAEVRAAVADDDGARITAAAHRLTGSLAAIHAAPARDAARAIEDAGRGRDAGRARGALAPLTDRLTSVVDALRVWRGAPSAERRS